MNTAETRYIKPQTATDTFNKIVARLTRMGISVYGSRILYVRGRSSGEWRTTPVNPLTIDGTRYLVAPRGTTQWVRNMRAAGGGELHIGRRVEPFTVTEVADGLWFPNGSVITPQGVLIVNETFGNRCTAFDLTGDGQLVNRRIWAQFGPLPADGATDQPGVAPDGGCLDAEGAWWLADATGSRLLRVAEGGEILAELRPNSPVYACALGGADGRTLYACVAPDFYEEARTAARDARLLAFRVAVPAV